MKEHISAVVPRTLPKPAGFSYGYEVKQGRLVFVAGQVARDEKNAVVGVGDIVAQFRQVCRNIQTVLSAAGGDMTDLVKLTIYVLDVADYKTHLREIGARVPRILRQALPRHDARRRPRPLRRRRRVRDRDRGSRRVGMSAVARFSIRHRAAGHPLAHGRGGGARPLVLAGAHRRR